MKNLKKTKIGLVDRNEKDFNKEVSKSEEELNSLGKELEKIEKKLNKLPAQQRMLMTDGLIGYILNCSKLSSYIITSILVKYISLCQPSFPKVDFKSQIKPSYLG